MSDYFTPSTEQVRSHYVFDQGDKWNPERGEAFDRWLSNHVAARLDRVKNAIVTVSETSSPGDELDVDTIVEWLAEIAEEMRK